MMENKDRQEKEEMSWDVTRQGIKRGKKKQPANLIAEICRTN